MGFVTILVQHSWSMVPNGSENSTKSNLVSPASRNSQKRSDSKSNSVNKSIKSNQVRLTDLSSIRSFMEAYNRASTVYQRQIMECEIRDILDRLSRLTLQSSITDTGRIDTIRSSLKPVRSHSQTSSESGSDKTRFYAAQARLSLVVFSSCRTRHLRERALDILLESLDTNALSYDPQESKLLFQLLDELRMALELVVDRARSKRSLIMSETESGDVRGTDVDMRVSVDGHMERLLKVNFMINLAYASRRFH